MSSSSSSSSSSYSSLLNDVFPTITPSNITRRSHKRLKTLVKQEQINFDEPIMDEYKKQPSVIKSELPAPVSVYIEKLNKLVIPNFYYSDKDQIIPRNELTNEEAINLLRKNRLKLPISTSSHESRILKQSGSFKNDSHGTVYNFPPCSNGNSCVGKKLPFRNKPEGGIIFMMYMFPEEYDKFIQLRETPNEKRPCLCCIRCATVDYLITTRMLKHESDCESNYNIKTDVDILPQLFTNLVDCDDGYLSSHMVYSQSADDPLIQGIARLQIGYLFFEPDKYDRSRYCLNQESIKWKPLDSSIKPNIGEHKKHFC
jgi:hypothetical protein